MEDEIKSDGEMGENYRKHPLDKVDNVSRQKDRIGTLVTQLTLGKGGGIIKNIDLVNRLLLAVSYLEGMFAATKDDIYTAEKKQLTEAYKSDDSFNDKLPEKYKHTLVAWHGHSHTVSHERRTLMFSLVQMNMLSNLEARVKAKSRMTTEVQTDVNNYLLDKIKERLWKFNQNWLAAFLGGSGTGKSFSAIGVADYIDPNFTIDNVFFDIKSLLEAISEKKIVKGSCAILDEAGISFSSREAMTKKNRQLSFLFQSMRYMNFGLIMTVPNLQLIDKHGRDLLHMTFRTLNINREEEFVHAKVRVIDFDPIKAEAYPKPPRIPSEGIQKIAEDMHIYKPRQELVDAYEIRKKAFGDAIPKMALNIEKKEKVKRKPNKKCDKCGYEMYSDALTSRCSSCGSRGMVAVGKKV